jgi:hypothetical protein
MSCDRAGTRCLLDDARGLTDLLDLTLTDDAP